MRQRLQYRTIGRLLSKVRFSPRETPYPNDGAGMDQANDTIGTASRPLAVSHGNRAS